MTRERYLGLMSGTSQDGIDAVLAEFEEGRFTRLLAERPWLLADGASAKTWAVRRGALLALREARLLDKLQARSLVREAARQVLKRLQPADPAR